jgi:orotidine-5'-phosphate decarboxylase
MYDPRQRLIVALDVSSAAAAQKIVAAVGESASCYKVGMQLYTAEGPKVVRDLVASGRSVFLDLKYHDIPNTVAAAVCQAAALGVSILTIHASGGGKMMRAATEAARTRSATLMVLGVTVLTSLDDNDLDKLGVSRTGTRSGAAPGRASHRRWMPRRGRLRPRSLGVAQ